MDWNRCHFIFAWIRKNLRDGFHDGGAGTHYRKVFERPVPSPQQLSQV